MSAMAEFFYNSKDGTVLGRTAGSWAKISFFYLVYYTLLGFLAYGTIGWYQSTVEDEPVPYIRTRTGQPGMAVEPANGVIEDNNNQNFEFNINDEDSYAPYIDRSLAFLKPYGPAIVDQFSKEKLNNAVKDRSMYYFIKVNKVNGWLPIGYKSARQMAAEGYFKHENCNENGDACEEVPILSFDRENPIQREDGVYFYCNSTNSDVKFEFESLNEYSVQLLRPETPGNYGFIGKAEYEKLNEGFQERRKWDAIGSLTAPFVPVKVSWGNAVGKISMTCYSVAQNIQVQRHIWVGLYEFGFTATNL